jgi:heme a synthase
MTSVVDLKKYRSANTPHVQMSVTAADRRVAMWLLFVALLVLAMVIVGGATRLTGSGLSITEWKPIHGAIPPLNAAEWAEEFAKYRNTPQYRILNEGMTMPEFQFIFWWEWAHRLLGRVIGLAFALPLLVFLATKQIRKGLAPRLWIMFALGGLQGAIGWWMVASGLTDERVAVAAYRLATHLGMAFALFGLLVWTAMDLLAPKAQGQGDSKVAPLAMAFCGLLYFQIILGAFVAGTHAGFAHNDWPLTDGRWIPQHYFALTPWWQNFVENTVAVQTNHRIAAYIVAAVAVWLWARSLKSADQTVRGLGAYTGVVVLAQVVLGIATLMLVVPLWLGLAHQALACLLLGLALLTWRAARVVG